MAPMSLSLYEYAFIVIVWGLLVATMSFGPLPGAQYTATKCVLVITLVGMLLCNPSTAVTGLYAVWVALVILQGALVKSSMREAYTNSDDKATNRPTLTAARWGTHEDPKYSIDVMQLLANTQGSAPVTTQTFLDAMDGVKQLRFQYPQSADLFNHSTSRASQDTIDNTDTMVVTYIVHEGDTIESKWIAFLQKPESHSVLDAPQFRVDLATAFDSPSQTMDLTQVVKHAFKHNVFGTIREDLTFEAFFEYLFPTTRTRLLYKTTAHTTVVAAPSPLYLYHSDPERPGLLQQFSLPGLNDTRIEDKPTPIEDEDTAAHMANPDSQHTTSSSMPSETTSASMPVFDRECTHNTDACVAAIREMIQHREDWTFVGTTIRRLEDSTDACDKECYAYWLAYFRGQMNRLALEMENILKIPEERLQSIAQQMPLFHLLDELKDPLATIRSRGAFQTITLSQMYDKVTAMMDNVDKPSLRTQMATALNEYLEQLDTNGTLIPAQTCLQDCKWSCDDARFGNGEMTVYYCRGCKEDNQNKCHPGADGYGSKWSTETYFAPRSNDE